MLSLFFPASGGVGREGRRMRFYCDNNHTKTGSEVQQKVPIRSLHHGVSIAISKTTLADLAPNCEELTNTS